MFFQFTQSNGYGLEGLRESQSHSIVLAFGNGWHSIVNEPLPNEAIEQTKYVINYWDRGIGAEKKSNSK